MKSHERTLLRAVLEAPADDKPRLKYATWLKQQGDPRGEFIEVQCELAAGTASTRKLAQYRARQDELLAEYGESWTAPFVRLGGLFPKFERGFVKDVLSTPPGRGFYLQEWR